jgi:peptidoglycan/xylan/chitin deacetylase (PgdA/CDA1 family)
MVKEGISSLLEKTVTLSGLLPWWEEHITCWPRVIFYHYVGNEAPPFLGSAALRKDVFLKQIAALRRRYRFLTWSEYKEALVSPRNAKRSILLSFDDGFQSSWAALEELAHERQIPAAFFVNTAVLDNAYAPWTVQYYFLRGEANGKFLEPLWKSISNGKPLSPAAARTRCHECFSIRTVVTPIGEGLAKFGMTPAELAQRYQLYVASADIPRRNNIIEIGNHSHSHYILSKLSDAELDQDLRSSDEILTRLLGTEPESFAYPFGIPGIHFDERCQQNLRAIGAYPYIFSAIDSLGASSPNNIGRICLDNADPRDVIGDAAKVTPRALKNWLSHRRPAGHKN